MRHRIRILAAFLLCLALRSKTLNAQCPITVDAGPDKFVCAAGNTVQLDGSISGSYIGSRWTPVTGLNNAAILNPVATVNNTVTYTLTAAAVDPAAPNLVNNPGFESGNSGFTSGYAFNPLPVTPGTYVLTTSPALVLSAFPPCDDHTFGNGTGYMMLCNGNGGASTQVWCQTIPVMANSWYTLSAWALCSPISPPVFQMKVNGVNAGTSFAAQGLGCVWQEFTATWFSGPATSANFCIFDISGSGNGLFGDDFALDDIFMAKACTVTDQVTVSVAPVNVVLPATVVLPCSAAETGIVLNGSGSSSGPGYTYSWDGPGILSGGNTLTPTVNETGTYTLSVSFDTGDGVCTKTASITVLPDPQTVVANAVATASLTCANNAVTISGAGSSVGGLVSYNWQPAAGIVSGSGTLFPVVNQPGQYTLLVTHNVSGCTATATAVVNQNVTPPAAAAAAPGTLPCIAGTLTLSGAGSTTGNNIAYLWTGPGIVSGGTTLNNCVVNAPGQYTLKVTNNVNGCTATATVNVVQSGTPPVVMAAANAPGALNCVTPALTLNSAGSSNDSTFTFLWSTANGHFTGPVNGQTAAVDSAGLYILTITNLQNGCTATDTVTVIADTIRPLVLAAANAPGALNCVTAALTLNSAGSSNDSTFTFLWTTPNGHFAGPVNGQSAAVDSAGLYILTITNIQNGCTATDTVAVIADTIRPLALAAANAPGALNCVTASLTLNSAGSSNDSTLVFLWTTFNGHITGPVNGQTTAVDAAGSYILTITNPQNGCAATDTVAVVADTVRPLALAAADAPGILNCLAPALTLSSAGSSNDSTFVFLWSTANGHFTGPVNGQTAAVDSAGSYILTITNPQNGCTATDTVSVLQHAGVSILPDSQTDPACFGAGNGYIEVLATGGDGTYTYTWDNGADTPAINNLSAGTYALTVTDGENCSATASFILSQPAELLAQAVATPTSAAGADDGTAAANPAGGTGPYTFLWNPGGAVTPQITGLTIGFYTVTVTDAHACTAVQTVEVLGGDCTVSALVSVMQPSCADLADGQASVTIAGGAPPYSYSWNSGGTGSLETGLTVGTYTVTVTDADGCTDTGEAILEAMDVELPVIQAVATTAYLGPSGSVTLTLANLGATASDNCSLASVQIVPDEFDCTDLGVRQVTLTASDVSGNSSSVTIPVTVVDNIPPTLECPPDMSLCFDERVVNYVAPVAIENCLSLGGQFAQVEGLPGGSEFPVGITVNTYTFTDAQGNTGSCSFQVTIRPPFSVVQDSIIQDTDNQHSGAVLVTVSGSQPGYTYLWTSNGQPVAFTEDLSGAGAGEYMLSVTDSAGCTAQAGPFVVSNLSATDNPDRTGRVGVFPNPTKGQLFLQFPPESASMEMDVAVYDATGRRVLEQHVAGKSRMELDLDGFADGFYVLSIRAAGQWGMGMWKIAVMR